MNFKKLINDIFNKKLYPLPHDPKLCSSCKYSPQNLKYAPIDDQHCYMFHNEPTLICMAYKKCKNN